MKVFSQRVASDIIEDLITDSGSKVVDCGHCGCVHYDSTGEFMDEGELENLVQQTKKEPEKYISHDGSVHWGTVMGMITVIGCPCNFLGWFEHLIWSNRNLVSEYLIKRSTEVLRMAKNDAKKASETRLINQM